MNVCYSYYSISIFLEIEVSTFLDLAELELKILPSSHQLPPPQPFPALCLVFLLRFAGWDSFCTQNA